MSRYPVIIDTNVPLTANGRATHADLDCQMACLERLVEIQHQGRVLVPIKPEDEAGQEFPNFPADPELQNFDRSDRKFVAVALASGENPPIVNATDTDWWIFREALNRNGIQIAFLCPQHMGE